VKGTIGRIAVTAFTIAVLVAAPARAGSNDVTAKGAWLASELDAMDVEAKWIAGAHIDWETGLPDGKPETHSGRHTHCSAFVAAAAKKLGVYILRPPEHGQILLANAQNEWLESEGAEYGWRHVDDPVTAQAIANRGTLVVASYHNHRDGKPGHIAIVKPMSRTSGEIEADGPMTIQAGTTNSTAIPVRLGFAGHPHAWADSEIDYYAHDVAGPTQ
jgi:hypothetical protein